ncbi:interleukin-12 subunit beta-like isoform X2 [Eleutherodactylus coqui]|uniref:interleukin-12 subunit beta-like isoform X2 n=1 Tax=Eleutherodactylus coqui TaxID=57060 RepID=UPI0034623EB9
MGAHPIICNLQGVFASTYQSTAPIWTPHTINHPRIKDLSIRTHSSHRTERKMSLLFLSVLVLGFHHLHSLPDSWPQHYRPVALRGKHIINCPLEALEVSWRFPTTLCVTGSTQQKTLNLHNMNNRCSGLYTCTNAHNSSHHYSQYLLIDGGSSLQFSCAVDSYSNHFLHCSLNEELNHPSLIRVKSSRFKKDQEWKEMKIPQDGDRFFSFDIPLPGFCPFEDYVDPIQVSIEVMSSSEHISGNKSFYMRDIVVPRAPENVSITKEHIIWSNPSWTHHLSFFPLMFELWVNYRNNTNVTKTIREQNYNVKDVTNISVRCRDLYNPSGWSSWITWNILTSSS